MKMGALNREVALIQNPAFGAGLLTQFCIGYAQGHRDKKGPALPLMYLVLPLLLHQESAQFIIGTQKASGLRAAIDKFTQSKYAKNDLLLALHDRTVQLKSLTQASLKIALVKGLLIIDDSGEFTPQSENIPTNSIPGRLPAAAEKFGYWCSSLTHFEISQILKIEL